MGSTARLNGRRAQRGSPVTRLSSPSPMPRSWATWSASRPERASSSISKSAEAALTSASSWTSVSVLVARAGERRPQEDRQLALGAGHRDGRCGLGGKHADQLHVPKVERGRAPLVEDLEHAVGALLIGQGDGRDRSWDVAGLLGSLPVEAWVGGHVRERERLTRGEDEPGDPLGGLHALANGAGSPRTGRDLELEPIGVAFEQGDGAASASKSRTVASTMDWRSRSSRSDEGVRRRPPDPRRHGRWSAPGPGSATTDGCSSLHSVRRRGSPAALPAREADAIAWLRRSGLRGCPLTGGGPAVSLVLALASLGLGLGGDPLVRLGVGVALRVSLVLALGEPWTWPWGGSRVATRWLALAWAWPSVSSSSRLRALDFALVATRWLALAWAWPSVSSSSTRFRALASPWWRPAGSPAWA